MPVLKPDWLENWTPENQLGSRYGREKRIKKAHDCNFGAVFFLKLWQPMLYTNVMRPTNLAGWTWIAVPALRCWSMGTTSWPFHPVTSRVKLVKLKPKAEIPGSEAVPLPSGLRCSLSPMTRLTKLWIPIDPIARWAQSTTDPSLSLSKKAKGSCCKIFRSYRQPGSSYMVLLFATSAWEKIHIDSLISSQ